MTTWHRAESHTDHFTFSTSPTTQRERLRPKVAQCVTSLSPHRCERESDCPGSKPVLLPPKRAAHSSRLCFLSSKRLVCLCSQSFMNFVLRIPGSARTRTLQFKFKLSPRIVKKSVKLISCPFLQNCAPGMTTPVPSPLTGVGQWWGKDFSVNTDKTTAKLRRVSTILWSCTFYFWAHARLFCFDF